MTIKKRVETLVRKMTGGVEIGQDGEPVIFIPGKGYQYRGYFVEKLSQLDSGIYSVFAGPEIPFSMIWDDELSWPEAFERMKADGAVYKREGEP